MQCTFQGSPYTQRLGLPRALKPQSKGQNLESTMHASQQTHTQPQKSTKGLACSGPNCFITSPKLGQHPHGLHYHFFFSFYIQNAQIAQLVGRWLGKYWDLGSNPRSPQIISIILFHIFPCSAHSRAHHTPNALACHMNQEINPVARTWSPPCTLVNRRIRNHKSQQKA